LDELQEQTWLRQAQAGQREAFARLVDAYWPRIHRWLWGLTRNAHAAEDLTQDVFLKAWAKLDTFQAGTHFRAWLFRLACNSFLDSRRGPRGLPVLPLPANAAGRDPDPVATLCSREIQIHLDAALHRLPLKFRAPFLLRMQEELPFEEIGKALGLTKETARWRVFKARKRLLQDLGPLLDRKGP
jgi:RNA polymerase sigma-70 factor (ECF subfamily)